MRYAFRVLLKNPGFMLAAVALIANYIPARRASQLDPTMALRHE